MRVQGSTGKKSSNSCRGSTQIYFLKHCDSESALMWKVATIVGNA